MSNAKKIKENLESEWEVYNPSEEDIKFKDDSSKIKKEMSSDWEVYTPPEKNRKETLPESLIMSPFRIGSDIGKAAYGAYKEAPKYFEKAKSEVPGLYQTAKEHPMHMLGQMAAGIPEMGQRIFNTPHKLIQYGANRLNLLPEKWGEIAKMSEMPDISKDINATFGEPKYPGEALARGMVRNIDMAVPIKKAAGMLVPTTNKSIANAILKRHDTLENQASQGFKDVTQMVKERNVPNVPIHHSLDISKIERFFPKSEETKELLNAAKAGDYDALRQVQSDLFKEAKESLGSKLNTERQKGMKMINSRDKINKAISDHLLLTGNSDLAEILNQSRKDYKTLQDVYYNKNISRSIKNLVNKEKREIPNNLSTIIKKDSKPMKKFREFHPGLESKSKKYGMQNALSKALYKYGLPAGGALSGLAGYEYLKDK